MRKSPRLYRFSILPSLYCPDQLWFMFSAAPELWGRMPLASPTPPVICETWKRGSSQRLRKIGCLCSHQRVTRYALACPGMGRGSLPLSSITRIPFPFLSTERIELLQRIRTMRDLEIHSILSLNFSNEETEAQRVKRSACNTQRWLRYVCGLKPSGQGYPFLVTLLSVLP